MHMRAGMSQVRSRMRDTCHESQVTSHKSQVASRNFARGGLPPSGLGVWGKKKNIQGEQDWEPSTLVTATNPREHLHVLVSVGWFTVLVPFTALHVPCPHGLMGPQGSEPAKHEAVEQGSEMDAVSVTHSVHCLVTASQQHCGTPCVTVSLCHSLTISHCDSVTVSPPAHLG